MTSTPSNRLLENLRWMADHTGFPRSRLPEKAELLLLIASAANGDNDATAASRP
jgi:hypothetical protein